MVFMQKTLEEIESKGFKVVDKDFERPCGGFLVIDEKQAQEFSCGSDDQKRNQYFI